MNKTTKIVNIYPSMAITSVNPPIRSTVKRVTKSVEEIRACLMSRAVVEEVLSNGKIVRLNIANYDKCLDEVSYPCKPDCTCGGNCGGWQIQQVNEVKAEAKTPWQEAYDKAIEGKNLATMTRKQRRSVEAAARAVADAAVATPEPEVVIGVATIETKEETKEPEVVVEEKVEVVENPVEPQEEEVVETMDVEDVSSIIE